MKTPKPGQQIVAIIPGRNSNIVVNVRAFSVVESGAFGYYGPIDEEISLDARKTRYVHGRLRIDEEGTKWVRGWDTEEARALCVLHGLTK